jgi:Tol biopolymer transport system component
MGEVFRARDTRLGREVAIKSLPAELSRDAERLARFEREAKLLASLNHPGIAAIHGLEEADGQPFLVLELVPGEDLAERLKRGPMPVEEAVPIAGLVAEALEEAHEKGIVHRDLKPANVKVTPDGKVKVLDFGLAKAWAAEAASGGSSDLSQSPTLARTGTAAGLILGTAAYMSPEQARGRPVDKRSDVWSFGVLLFEMLSGRRLFEGETVSDTLAAVLKTDPDWTALPNTTPPHVRRLLRRCLERDPRRRLRDIGEARIALQAGEGASEGARGDAEGARAGEGGRNGSAARRPSRWLVPAALAAAALAFAAGWALRRPVPPPERLVGPGTVVRQLTFDPGLETEPSLSPDGNSVAYTTDERGSLDILVAPVAGGTVRVLAGTERDEAQPAWSPDGTQVAFTVARDADGRLKATGGLSSLSAFVQGEAGDIVLVPAAGGTPVRLVEHGAYPAWSPDGRAIAFQSERGGQRDIWTVPTSGGEPRRITDDPDLDYQPAWSPDGRWIAYGSLGLHVVPADGSGPPRRMDLPVTGVLAPAWSADGRWLYFSASRSPNESWTSLWRLPFRDGRSDGPVERITLGELADVDPSVAAGGRLAYARVSYSPDLWELDARSGALRRITATSCLEDYPDVSPDGRTIVFHSDRSGRTGLFSLGADGTGLQPVTGPDIVATMPRWSPDGRTLAFVDRTGADWSIAVRPVDGLTVRRLVTRALGLQGPQWSPDGRRLAYSMGDGNGSYSIHVVDLDGTERLVAAPGGLAMFPSWSPDGRLVAFQHEKNGPRQIWVAPAEGGEARPVSSGAAELSHPQWSRADPDRILVVVDHKNLAFLSVAKGTLEPLTRFDQSTRYVDYPSLSRDGTRVLFSMTLRTGDVFLLENR